MREKTCCFTGHREIEEKEFQKVKKKVKAVIVSLIEKGVLYFGAGGALGFDTLAAEIVLELKKNYPQIKLILVLPCPEQTRGWNKKDVQKYEQIKAKADKVVYTADHYYRGCMHVRNRHLVDNSAYCICYLIKEHGGTAYTVDYATEKGLGIYNIAKM